MVGWVAGDDDVEVEHGMMNEVLGRAKLVIEHAGHEG